MFVRVQNVKRDENGIITSGSATLLKSEYDPNAIGGHSRQVIVERLGKVVWLEDKKENNEGEGTKRSKLGDHGIYFSPTRGLVEYDLEKDLFSQVSSNDSRIKGTPYAHSARIHTEFGPAYLFFRILSEKTQFLKVIGETFTDRQLQKKVLVHLSHDCLRNRENIKCGAFYKNSILSHILTGLSPSEMDCDTPYYEALSDDNLKVTFFKNLIKTMRKTNPRFGRCCYADSTPLPGEAKENPFNELCSHGTDGLVIQSRLGMVLDIETNIPVWFFVFPSNVLDSCTIDTLLADVKITLDIEIDEMSLDAGYARTSLFEKYNLDNASCIDEDGIERERILLIRMPAKNGYPHDELYIESKPRIHDASYLFDYDGHTFYGERYERLVRGYREYCYVYVDKQRAQALSMKYREENPEAWAELCPDDKNWYSVKDGFFILTGNKMEKPVEAYARYKNRSEIEGFFKDSKSYLDILPLNKWYKETILGKVFNDVIETILYRQFRYYLSDTNMSMGHILVTLRSLGCAVDSEGIISIDSPKSQVTALFERLNQGIPGHIELKEFSEMVINGTPMDPTPLTKRRSKPGAKVKHSPEEKNRIAEEAKRKKEEAKRLEKERKAAERAAEKERKAAEREQKVREKAAERASKTAAAHSATH